MRCREVPVPHQIIELKVEPFTDVRCVAGDLFVSSPAILAACRAAKELCLVDQAHVPETLGHVPLEHTQCPSQLEDSNLSFGVMVLVVPSLLGVVDLGPVASEGLLELLPGELTSKVGS